MSYFIKKQFGFYLVYFVFKLDLQFRMMKKDNRIFEKILFCDVIAVAEFMSPVNILKSGEF